MIPTTVRLNSKLVDDDGKPYKGVQIFENHLEIHPDFKDIALQGLKAAFGNVFTIQEEGDAINTD